MRKIILLIVLSLIISANAWADATMPLNFTAVNGTATVALNRVGTPNTISLQYSTDSCTTWNTYSIGDTITIANGATVYLKATTTNSAFGAGLSYYNFSMTGTVYADGNIMSLLDQTMNRTSLSTYAFYHLFENCSTLIHAPELPATTLANHCYAHLFQNCSSLAETPILPASSLSKSGYYKMFYGCTSLTTIPSLPATSLAEKCYKQMFDSCTSLVVNTQAPGVSWSIPGNALNYDATSFEDMFTNTAGTMNGEPSVGTVYYIASPETRQYLNFTAVDSAATISLLAQGTPPAITLQYSVDTCSTWNTYTVGNIITLDSGATVYFKALTTNGSFGSMMGNYHFTMSGTVAAGGNIMSLLDATMTQTSVPQYAFFSLFANCASLTSAPSLPATTLSTYCYGRMFYDCPALVLPPTLPAVEMKAYCYREMFSSCSSLAQAPALPATSLNDGCYYQMFKECSSLTLPPTLPADTLKPSCYYAMFWGCTLLTHAPALPATSLSTSCYHFMFHNCSTLTQAPSLPATTLTDYCYSNMFNGCTSLTQPPALPATTLQSDCYQNMFTGCTSLAQAPALPADTLANGCYDNMFGGCTTLAQPPALPATTLAKSCYKHMFDDCTSLSQPPSLPATSLAVSCYEYMFYRCTSLSQPPTLPADTLANSCYSCMFVGCTSLTHTPVLSATTLAESCYQSMFEGCTSLTHAPELPADSLPFMSYYQMFLGCTTLTHIPQLPTIRVLDSFSCDEMFSGCSSLVVNTQAPGTPWSIPYTGGDTPLLDNMLAGTAGTMNDTPSVNTIYYVASMSHQVTVNINDTTMGSVSGGGIHYLGDTITLVATPAANHHFVSWSNGATTPTISFALTQDTSFTATFEADAFTGTVDGNLHWSIDSISGELLFTGTGSTPDYSPTSHAPWYYKRSFVTHVTTPAGVITRLGDYVFDDFSNLYYAELNADSLGESLFNACNNLTLCYSETNATANANTMDGCNANPLLIVQDYQWYKHTYTDSLGLPIAIYPYRTDYTQDSLLTLNAAVTLHPSIKGISVNATRQDVNGTPLQITDDCNIIWKDSLVAPLVYEFLSQGVGYFGKNSFAGCSGIHNITVSPKYWCSAGTYAFAHLDSIHADAFDSIYPDIVDLYEETKYQPGNVKGYTTQKTNLNQTLLYVPDTLAATGKTMWAQYTATPFWDDNFADISNKGLVDTQYVDTAYADIYFYYQEAFDSVPVVEYHLILYKIGGTDTADVYFSNDTSFVIARIPRIIVIVDSVTGNTTTITISIDHAAYNPNIQEVNIHMEHLAENSSYSITLSPLDESGNALVIDTCTMTTTTVTSLPEIQYDENENFFPTANTDVYLITGQYIGKYTFSLPPGVYLMREDKRWYKFAVSRQ